MYDMLFYIKFNIISSTDCNILTSTVTYMAYSIHDNIITWFFCIYIKIK